MAISVAFVGTIDPYMAAAMSPDGETLYVNHDGSEVVAYTYPGLVAGSTVATPDVVGGELGNIACDGDGVLYWWENTNGAGTNLYGSTDPGTPIYATVDEQFPVGLCWSPYDGLLYGFGMVVVTEGQVLSSWDPDVVGGDRQLIYTPPGTSDLFDWVNNTVPTLDGLLWWVWPHSNPAAWRLRHWSIPAAAPSSTVNVIEDGVVPWKDSRVYWYGDPSGAAPAKGYYDSDLGGGVEPEFDQFTQGQRCAAYTPSFSRVCFQRGDTGEVWRIVGRGWWLGVAGWG